MIRRIEIENFCSFRDVAEVDFRTGSKTPTDDSFVKSITGDQMSVLMGVFGPNASGKTNLLKALAFLAFFLRSSYKARMPEGGVPVDPFFGQSKQPVRLQLEFEGYGNAYRYQLRLSPKTVLEEKILVRNPKTGIFRMFLSRQAGKTQPLIEGGEGAPDLKALRHLLRDRPDASLLSAGLVTGEEAFQRIHDALGIIETNVDRFGKTEATIVSRNQEIFDCARYFQDNAHFIAQVEERLRGADLGIERFFIEEREFIDEKGKTKRLPFPFVTHRSGGESYVLPLAYESSGTKRLFTLLRAFLPVLTDGGVAVIDEMEADLHPHLIPLLLDLFVDKDTNPKRAQLLFTCHHVEILNHLSKEQIILVEKDKDNVSHARRLSEIKGVRREENFFANYNAGRYDAVPEPIMF
ncbi:MAG TPA: ATP-binding protein [Opitutales bacterium]|nr:ATP-binding protein [Opitutales bacterium]